MNEPIPTDIGAPLEPAQGCSSVAPLRAVATAALPTRFGEFRVVAFDGVSHGREHIALVRGIVNGADRVPVRVHSECLTGDALGSLRCDCRDQLTASLQELGRQPRGVLLYMRQEGRGIGLTNKIRAYALQDLGHDTVEANRLLGFGDDPREYRTAAQMLRALGVGSILLITNNPAKLRGLERHGIRVADRIPVVVPANRHNAGYLATKRRRFGHWLPGPASAAPGAEPAGRRPGSEPTPPPPATSAASGSGRPRSTRPLRARRRPGR